MKKKHHRDNRFNKLEISPERRSAPLEYIMKKKEEAPDVQVEERLPRWLRRQKRAKSRGDQRIRPGRDRGFKII